MGLRQKIRRRRTKGEAVGVSYAVQFDPVSEFGLHSRQDGEYKRKLLAQPHTYSFSLLLLWFCFQCVCVEGGGGGAEQGNRGVPCVLLSGEGRVFFRLQQLHFPGNQLDRASAHGATTACSGTLRPRGRKERRNDPHTVPMNSQVTRVICFN